jgi:hypothetical protein
MIRGVLVVLGLLFVGIASLLVLYIPAALASPQDIVAPSLVYLTIDYTPTKGPKVGVPQTDQATGFLVSDDGFILTSYHLLENLSETAGENASVHAVVGDNPEAQPVTAAIVNGVQPLDLLLLKIRAVAGHPYPFLKLGRVGVLNTGDHIYTSGFNDKDLLNDEGTVNNKLGPLGLGYLWTINISIAPGQSGSPVYQSDGTVVGIIKGENKATGKGYMVPIDFADALISFLRFRELNQQLVKLGEEIGWKEWKEGENGLAPRLTSVEKGMQDVSTNFTWQGQVTDGGIVLKYIKLVSGAPYIKSVLLNVVPLVTSSDTHETTRDKPLVKDADSEARTVNINPDGKGGSIRIEGIDKLINFRLQSTPKTSISKLDISIAPTLDDGHKVDPVSVPVDLEGK